MISLEVFLSFLGDLLKMYRIYKKILHAYQGDIKILSEKWYMYVLEILWLISGSSLKIREIPHIWCM